MANIVKQKFFEQPTLVVAKKMLGKYLVRRYHGKIIRAMITEVEAYDGFKDKASHASRGITKRNFPMFGPAGHWYVYFTYGMHWMLNIVTKKKGYPAAILIRGVQSMEVKPRYIEGPARVTKFLKINGKFNNKKADRKIGLWIEDNPRFRSTLLKVKSAPRIGVAYAGPAWAGKKYRFYIEKKGVSR